MGRLVEVIRSLETATEGSRVLDRQLAELIGWKRVVREDTDEAGRSVTRGVWYEPNTAKPGTIPNYTGDIDAAQSLVFLVAPGNTGGCGWESGRASAKVDGSFTAQAKTPALALCSAAMRLLHFASLKT